MVPVVSVCVSTLRWSLAKSPNTLTEITIFRRIIIITQLTSLIKIHENTQIIVSFNSNQKNYLCWPYRKYFTYLSI